MAAPPCPERDGQIAPLVILTLPRPLYSIRPENNTGLSGKLPPIKTRALHPHRRHPSRG